MTAEQNKAIFLRFMDELRKGNLAIIDESCSPDFAFHSPNWPNWLRGLEGARKLATYGRTLFRDTHGTLDAIIAEGDKVAVRWTLTGTWIGERRPGLPDYGEKVVVGAMSWYRFVDGKIAEDWGTEVFWPSGTPESEIREWRGNP
jgi:ketosteroid isomerase-like protein